MNIKNTAISAFAKYVIGGQPFEHIKKIVAIIETSDLKGKDKQQAAFNELRAIGLEISTMLLNVGIELACLYFKTLV